MSDALGADEEPKVLGTRNGVVLRMTGRQHAALFAHLFPGDGREAVAVALCGRVTGSAVREELRSERQALMVHRVVPVPYADCYVREPDCVRWRTGALVPLLEEAARRGMAILKIHSHPGDYRRFSRVDDRADRNLFSGISGWTGHDQNASAIMLPDGSIFARIVEGDGTLQPIATVSVAGDDIRIWHLDEVTDCVEEADRSDNASGAGVDAETALRTKQAFGDGTVRRLRRLSVAIVGVSGTGSPVAEMLGRLSIGEMLLVDDDRVQHKNRPRILHSLPSHAERGEYKVHVLADAVSNMDLGTKVVAIPKSLWHAEVVRRISQVDVIFGCMDSVDGRDLLNRLAAYYNIPYFDIGVHLQADGRGGVDQICGTVHYLQPDGSSLASRGVYTPADVRAAALRRREPAAYAEQVLAKYLRGTNVDRPAVISVNMFFAAHAVNELLARIHGYRDEGNAGFASFGMSLSQARLITEEDGVPCTALSKKAGRGDGRPLLDVPELGIRNAS